MCIYKTSSSLSVCVCVCLFVFCLFIAINPIHYNCTWLNCVDNSAVKEIHHSLKTSINKSIQDGAGQTAKFKASNRTPQTIG